MDNEKKKALKEQYKNRHPQMGMETFPGSLKDKGGYVVYDMYFNA